MALFDLVEARFADREADIGLLDAALAQFSEPLHQRLEVMPTWVENQLRDLVVLLSDTAKRMKGEFRRLGLSVTMHPIHDEAPQPFYRAAGHAALPCLAGTRDWSSCGPIAPPIGR